MFNNYRCTAINHQFSLLRYLYILVSLLIIMSLLLLSGDIHLNPGPLIDNCISFWHGNVHGLNSPSKLRSLFNIVNNYDIIALTETFFYEDLPEVQHANYLRIFRRDRPGRSGGGVAVLVSNSLVSIRKPELELPNLEMLWVEIVSRTKLLVGVCYHLTRVPLFGRIFNTPLTWRDRLVIVTYYR